MCEYSKHQLSAILEIAIFMDKNRIPVNIPSEDLLRKRIDKASTALLSTELPDEQTKNLVKTLRTRYTKLLKALEGASGLPEITRYCVTDRVLIIAYILLKSVQSPSTLKIEDSIERAATTLGLELEHIEVITLTKHLNEHLKAGHMYYGNL